jgi:hypothetical protein
MMTKIQKTKKAYADADGEQQRLQRWRAAAFAVLAGTTAHTE